MTTISVAMATYNGAPFILEQLESIAAQDRPPDELVISDDDSNDDTLEILDCFARTAPFRVNVLKNRDRLGSTGNFERAIRACSGEIIAMCDQDDVWYPEKLALNESALGNASVGLVFSNGNVVDAGLKPLGYSLWDAVGFSSRNRQSVRARTAYDFMLARWFITGATVAFRSDLIPLILPFPRDLPGYIHDRWTALLIAAVARIECIDQSLILYRQHLDQQLGARRSTVKEEMVSRGANRKPGLATDRNALIAISARLATHPEWHADTAFIVALDSRLRHLDARLRLSKSRFARVPTIWRELASGRYQRCSSGILSAAKDFVM